MAEQKNVPAAYPAALLAQASVFASVSRPGLDLPTRSPNSPCISELSFIHSATGRALSTNWCLCLCEKLVLEASKLGFLTPRYSKVCAAQKGLCDDPGAYPVGAEHKMKPLTFRTTPLRASFFIHHSKQTQFLHFPCHSQIYFDTYWLHTKRNWTYASCLQADTARSCSLIFSPSTWVFLSVAVYIHKHGWMDFSIACLFANRRSAGAPALTRWFVCLCVSLFRNV